MTDVRVLPRFYAPWCGHCQNLKSGYEKAAKNLAGLAKVAAINCDEDSNKPFCGQMSVQGFPTLKIVKPGTKPGRPIVEDYQGARSAKAIVDAVIDKIPNHVKKVHDNGLDAWLAEGNDTAKAILFTEKGTISALLRALAVDFLDGIAVAQIRSKESTAVEMFGITTFPTLVLLPGGQQNAMVYHGEMKKGPMLAFLSQAATPNPDPAPQKGKAPSSTRKSESAASSASSAFAKASKAHKPADASEAAASASTITLDDNLPTESPDPIVPPADTPIAVPVTAPPIPILSVQAELVDACFKPKSGSCILALLPIQADAEAMPVEEVTKVLSALANVKERYVKRQGNIFPFYAIPASNEAANIVRGGLGLNPETNLEVLAVNMKRNWWRKLSGKDYDSMAIEGFVDNIKLGEGPRDALPEGFLARAEQKTTPKPEDVPEPDATPEPEDTPEPRSISESEAAPKPELHDEL